MLAGRGRPYAFANISARKISPVLIIAQMIRASLLASATVTRRAGFFARSALIQSAARDAELPQKVSTLFNEAVGTAAGRDVAKN